MFQFSESNKHDCEAIVGAVKEVRVCIVVADHSLASASLCDMCSCNVWKSRKAQSQHGCVAVILTATAHRKYLGNAYKVLAMLRSTCNRIDVGCFNCLALPSNHDSTNLTCMTDSKFSGATSTMQNLAVLECCFPNVLDQDSY